MTPADSLIDPVYSASLMSRFPVAVLALVACGLALRSVSGQSVRPLPAAGSPGVEVWVTSDIAGEVETPRCCGELNGGLPKRVSLVRQARQDSEGAILLLDGGDMFHPQPEAGPRLEGAIRNRAELLSDAAAELAYDALVPGDTDLASGWERYEQLIARSRASALCANIVTESTSPVRPFAIWEIHGVTIGVTGVVDPALVSKTVRSQARVRFEVPEAALRKVIRDLRKAVDVTVVFAHTGWDEAVRLGTSVEGIDVIFGGHTSRHEGHVETVGRTLMLDLGARGHTMGHLTIRPGARGEKSAVLDRQIEASIVPIRPSIPSSPEWDERVRSIR